MLPQTEKITNYNKLKYPLILFDGYCNLCSFAVNFILKKEKKPLYYFLSIQSPTLSEIYPELKISDPPESIILIQNDKIFKASTAALKISRNLKFPWHILYYAIYLPLFLRDPLYRFIAKKRYRWFGKKNVCYMPKENWKARFMD
ncbi:MAG: DCC1-like thiol-disulfide oxidoreductase family protein [Bacteroidales bacterium]|nr:DCC1-like thiol-disulfide oxidoreductase family protein [Bacteroidales bacterium]MCF8390337.1 DCC1-like thiol-disulfide oxidoreductase family protein [Bacteroidales bacterium]